MRKAIKMKEVNIAITILATIGVNDNAVEHEIDNIVHEYADAIDMNLPYGAVNDINWEMAE